MAHDDHKDRTIESLQREVERLQKWLDDGAEWVQGLEAYEKVKRERDQARAAVGRLRGAIDGPIRSIAYDVKQGGILGELLLEEIEKALTDTGGK